MDKIDLGGIWKMKSVESGEWIDAIVPGTVFTDLRNAGIAEDPYYRDNEDRIQHLFLKDYEYEREFEVAFDRLESDEVLLCCEGLDTLADIYLNDRLIANTANMHRTYKFDVKNILMSGKNKIHIIFHSPKKFIDSNAQFSMLPSVIGNTGAERLRKAQCAFGWDWGISLPDSGIWKDIYILFHNTARIEEFYIAQEHENGRVFLQIDIDYKIWADKAFTAEIIITSPDGQVTAEKGPVDASGRKYTASIEIPGPELWWPSGCGGQPLYEVAMLLKDGSGIIDFKKVNIGLRTIVLRREEDEWGRSYEFIVNGKPVFMRGSNLIIEDSVITGYSDRRTEKMLQDCADSNFNCVRVWGGAFYPHDSFYETCDRLGLLVYHDFMFACNIYPVQRDFIENICQEIRDNVKRVRHHPCLGVWNGNNETEIIIEMFTSTKEPLFKHIREFFGVSLTKEQEEQIKSEYKTLFADVIPALLKEIDPQTPYTRSSPSCDNFFERVESRGDGHYYIAHMGMLPYRRQRDYCMRFVSEMGFQSYPGMKTIKAFALPEDCSPNSPVMLKHQKSRDGNKVIEDYMEKEFRVPADFGLYVYASQILAGEILKYAVEHLRRNRGRCMGIITWQMNDCWPVISWSGLDYFGRWKAQQYYTKRFFEPVLISACETGSYVDICVTNDKLYDMAGTVKWAVRDNASHIIASGEKAVYVEALTAKSCIQMELADIVKDLNFRKNYLEFSFLSDSGESSDGTLIFVPAKEFDFLDPVISVRVEEDEKTFQLTLQSRAYAKAVGLELKTADCLFSDNYFDISAGRDKIVEVKKESLSEKIKLDEFKRQLEIVSVYDIA